MRKLTLENHDNEFFVLKNVLSPEECDFYTEYMFTNSEPDNKTPRLNMKLYILGNVRLGFPIENDPHPSKRKLAEAVQLSYDFITENFELDSELEFKRSFVHVMQEGSEIDPHNDDGEIYDGKLVGEKHYSAVLVFNDNYQGGDFVFRDLNKRLKTEAGSLLIFRGDQRRIHGVETVTAGYRISMPIFFRTVPS